MPWLQHLVDPLLNVLMPLALRTPDSSADSMLLASLAPAEKVAGQYFHNNHLSRPNGVSALAIGCCKLQFLL
jgi:hypothetical protein